jgi:pimeloyl-ACP methyl ester carboxylesterase
VKERSLPPPCLQDTSYGKHSYLKLKDIKLHYVENGDKSKPLILLCHGFPEFWFSWRHQLKYFAKTHWVVAIDMRGYGDSEKPKKISDYDLPILEKDIVEVVRALGKEKCVLVGHDWGGAVSWNVAANNPQVVDKLVILNAPHPHAFQKKVKSSLGQFFKSWYVFLFQLPILPELTIHVQDLDIFRQMFLNANGQCCVSDEDLEAFKYTFSKKGAWTPPLNYYRNVLSAKRIVDPNFLSIPKIKCPTLIIWGENDIALSKDLPELTREFVDDIRIEYLARGTHFIQNDMPDEVNKSIQKFVS